jgi:hypothetical protein
MFFKKTFACGVATQRVVFTWLCVALRFEYVLQANHWGASNYILLARSLLASFGSMINGR